MKLSEIIRLEDLGFYCLVRIYFDSFKGITNFMNEDKYQIGQGLITYGKEVVYNWITTLSDSVRVGADMGALRFSLKHFNRPLFSFKG